MSTIVWVLLVLAVIVGLALAFALVRRSRRSGSVLAADQTPKGRP